MRPSNLNRITRLLAQLLAPPHVGRRSRFDYDPFVVRYHVSLEEMRRRSALWDRDKAERARRHAERVRRAEERAQRRKRREFGKRAPTDEALSAKRAAEAAIAERRLREAIARRDQEALKRDQGLRERRRQKQLLRDQARQEWQTHASASIADVTEDVPVAAEQVLRLLLPHVCLGPPFQFFLGHVLDMSRNPPEVA